MKALVIVAKGEYHVIEIPAEKHPPYLLGMKDEQPVVLRHVSPEGLFFCCYVPNYQSDKWARKRLLEWMDLDSLEKETKPVKNDIDFDDDPDAVMAKIGELIAEGLTSLEAIRDANMGRQDLPDIDLTSKADWGERTFHASESEIEKTLVEVDALVPMQNYIDERIDEKLWIDFTLPKGTTPEGMKFHIHYLKAFAAEIGREVYWHTRTAILRDRALLVDTLVKDSHGAAVRAGWYNDPATGERVERNFGEMLALAHSEISEALEADRKDLMDDKLPQYHGTFVELVDLMIRGLDTLGMLQDRAKSRGRDVPSIGQIYVDKRSFNDERADHKPENRAKANGKAY